MGDPAQASMPVVAAGVDDEALLGSGGLALVATYYDVLRAIPPPASLRLFRDNRWTGLQRLASAMRPRLGYSRFLIRHMRAQLAAVDSADSIRLVVRPETPPSADDAAAGKRMRDALPTPYPPWLLVVAGLGVILLTQALLRGLDSLLSTYAFRFDSEDISAQLTALATPNVTSIDSFVSALAHTYAAQVFEFILALSIAVYVLFRLPAGGFRLAGMALNAPGFTSWRHRRAPLTVLASKNDGYGLEQRVFRKLGTPPPSDLPMDLLVKAAALAGPWFLVIADLRYPGGFGAVELIVGIPVALRLCWLVATSTRRSSSTGTGLLVLGIALVALAGVLAQTEPSVGSARARLLTTTNATGHDELQRLFDSFTNTVEPYGTIKGVDFQGRNLSSLNLPGVILSESDLSDADLARSDLTSADLSGSSLDGADVAGANLEGVLLRDATLTNANLAGANLDSANLTNARLEEATLIGANLGETNLLNARLVSADLDRASLRGASLVGTRLNGASLVGASLVGARLDHASLASANLDGADLDRASVAGTNFKGACYDQATKWPRGVVPPNVHGRC